MPFKQSRPPKITRIIPNGKAKIVTQQIKPTTMKTIPKPNPKRLPNKPNISPTNIQISLNGNRMRLSNKPNMIHNPFIELIKQV